ncbi:MAG: squalene/phytoene synthase family protein [Planctomycetota bacterium]|nr:squalene/phytoene synthase family protein [Planctomycetota bacterium]
MSTKPPPTSTAVAGALPESQAWSDALTRSHSENFSVLSFLVPREDRAHFAAVYAFCRVADDLADQTGNDAAARSKSLELLSAFRAEFIATCPPSPQSPPCPPFPPVPASAPSANLSARSGLSTPSTTPRWPHLFTALAATMRERQLPAEPFHLLLDAFEEDQHRTRYETWDQLVRYSAKSANPVGHLVLMIFGYRPPLFPLSPPSSPSASDAPSLNPSSPAPANLAAASHAELFKASDDICTALQLINFWQDVRRDLLERDRIYLPLAEMRVGNGVQGVSESQVREWMAGPVDPAFGAALMPLVLRTKAMFEAGRRIDAMLPRQHRRVIRLFSRGGEAIVEKVLAMNAATLWSRPRLRGWEKALLVMREWVGW